MVTFFKCMVTLFKTMHRSFLKLLSPSKKCLGSLKLFFSREKIRKFRFYEISSKWAFKLEIERDNEGSS